MALAAPHAVDSHTHLLPGRLGEKVREYFLQGYRPEDLAYPIDHDEIRARMAADGIGEVWHLPYVHKPGMAEGVNAASAATARPRRGRRASSPARRVHPADDDARRHRPPGRRGPRGARRSRCTARWAITPPTTPASTRCGSTSPTSGCRSSSTSATR